MGNRAALLVGINDYGQRSGLKPLKHAIDDAVELARLLASKEFGFQTRLLTAENAKYGSIVSALEEYENGPELDLFLFYFSGHGEQIRWVGTHCLHCFGSRASNPESVISLPVLSTKIHDHIPSQHSVMILDACRDEMWSEVGVKGPGGWDPSLEGSLHMSSPHRRTIGVVPRDEGETQLRVLVTLMACESRKSSHEDYEKKHGLFTWALLEELGARGKKLPLRHISDAVGQRMLRRCSENERLPLQVPYYAAPALPIHIWFSSQHPEVRQVVGVLGLLLVKCNMDGAELWIDGSFARKLKQGERVRLELREGWHRVRVTRAAQVFERAILIEEDKEQRLDIDLEPSVGEKWISPADGREMVWIPPGSFQMGSPRSEMHRVGNEEQHAVRIERGFWLDTTEVTNEAYRKFVLANPQWQKGRVDQKYHNGNYLLNWNGNDYPSGKANHPVVWLSWCAAKAHAEWAGKRLPSEAEWEYACRAGTTTVYWWGDSFDGSHANNNRQGTVAVGDERHKNPLGLYDMLGNVWEWTSSLYKPYPYRFDDGREDPNASGARVLRGGSWRASPWDLRSAGRCGGSPVYCRFSFGFRCVR